MNKIILFDVDKTLFDTGGYFSKTLSDAIIAELGITKQELEQKEEKYRSSLDKYTDFEPNGFLTSVSGLKDINELASKTYRNQDIFIKSVSPDTLPTIESLQIKGYRLGIFSEANIEWQKSKLKLSGLEKLFEPELTFISTRKTTPDFISQLPSGAWVVDDNQEVISDLSKFDHIKPIWINRNQEENLNPSIPSITSLTKVESIIINN
jgi:FMN phosphatase YigB (HAD superfamily)